MTTGNASTISRMMRPELIAVRATVHLTKLPAGRVVFVDPSDPYVVMCLKRGFLIEVEATDASA